jgi:hypothetical protein
MKDGTTMLGVRVGVAVGVTSSVGVKNGEDVMDRVAGTEVAGVTAQEVNMMSKANMLMGLLIDFMALLSPNCCSF